MDEIRIYNCIEVWERDPQAPDKAGDELTELGAWDVAVGPITTFDFDEYASGLTHRKVLEILQKYGYKAEIVRDDNPHKGEYEFQRRLSEK
jgi:hypothetical protein